MRGEEEAIRGENWGSFFQKGAKCANPFLVERKGGEGRGKEGRDEGVEVEVWERKGEDEKRQGVYTCVYMNMYV